MPIPLSELTGKVLAACFGQGPRRDRLAARLESEVAENVGAEGNVTFVERARISVIRLVVSNPDAEEDTFRLAAEDVRDLLMAAGHGLDTSAHLEWSRKVLRG